MRRLLVMLAAGLLCSCSTLTPEVKHYYAEDNLWDTPSAFTTADARIITQRQHPLLNNQVVCTEPNPDVAKALSTALTVSASGGNGAANGSLSGSSASGEALAELAGRSTALLGLRDGLYRACEAYANGIIGQDAYALVISRYGQLMTTLFLGQDIASAAGAEGKAGATAAALQALGSQQGGNTATTTTTTTPAAGKSSANIPNATPAAATPAVLPTVFRVGATANDLTPHLTLVAAPAPAPGAAGGGAPAPAAANPPAAQTSTTTSNSPSQSPQTASSAAVSTASALALARMNEDFMHEGLLGPLLVACINNGDPSRLRTPLGGTASVGKNTFLDTICGSLTLASMQSIAAADAKAAWPPVQPEAAAVQLSAGSQKQGATTPPAPTPDPVVKAVQEALQKQVCAGCNPGTADGINGSKTTAAMKAYQAANGLTVNGNPKDSATMKSLGVVAPAADAAPAPAPAPAAPGAAPVVPAPAPAHHAGLPETPKA
jgi:hypothetical protein